MTRVFRYDRGRYPFDDVVREMLGQDDLETLRGPEAADAEWSIYKVMETAPHYVRLCEALLGPAGETFRTLYHRFVAEIIRPAHGEPILYQACPTPRLLFADAGGASGGEARFHRDSDYGHDRAEVNYTVALTPIFASNAIWIESAPEAADYAPIELRPGEYARFDGASLRHGAVTNETGRSRVSFDFRVVPRRLRTNQRIVAPGTPERLDAHLFTSCP